MAYMVDQSLTYTGWKKWTPTNEEWNTFCMENRVPFEMQENEYLIVYDNDNIAYYYCYEKGKFRPFKGGSIKFIIKRDLTTFEEVDTENNKKRTKSTGYKQEKTNIIMPKNEEQCCAFDLLNNDNITCKLLTGTYGSGKTMLATYTALRMLNAKKVDKIIWLRNNIIAAGTEQIGYLPGSEFEKLKPWLGPFIDHLGNESRVIKLVESGQLEVPALSFIRGRNFENAVVICSEAQNLTEELVKLIIGRMGENSYLIFDGDFKHQIDKPIFEKSPGLKRMIQVLAGNSLFGYVDLPKSERSDTARLADLFDNL